MGRRVEIRTLAGQDHSLNNVIFTLQEAVVRKAIGRLASGELRARRVELASLQDQTTRFVDSAPDRSKALYTVNAFYAFAAGWLDYQLPFGSAPVPPEGMGAQHCEDFLQHYHQFQVNDDIRHHAAMLDCLYHASPPEGDEYVIGSADRLILTSRRLVLFTDSAQSGVLAAVPLSEVLAYSVADQ